MYRNSNVTSPQNNTSTQYLCAHCCQKKIMTSAFLDKQLSYCRETAWCTSYFDSQNCEMEFL